MMSAPRKRSRDERGAVALITGFLALLLVGIAALAVDLGAGFVEKNSIQKRADFAALAGSLDDDLPMAAAGGTCPYGTAARASDQAIIDAAAYLSDQPGGSNITPAALVNCNLGDGEAGFGKFARSSACAGGICLTLNENQLSVISQTRTVDFGFASVLGFESVDVQGWATVEIKTPLQQTLPLYAHSGCDYGSQTIKQPTNGQSSTGVNLAFPSDKNNGLELTTLGTNPVSATTPPTVQVNSSTTTLTITGTGFGNVKQVGFFQSATPTAPNPITVAKAPATGGFTETGGTTITVTIPTSVTSVQDVWFVRLLAPKNASTDEWSAITRNGNTNSETNLMALPFTVGNVTLSCAQGSSDGNFGTLDLPNRSTGAPFGQDDNIAYNIAYGLQYGLAPYDKDFFHPPAYECVDGQDGGIGKTWVIGEDNSGTNCVGTQPGLRSNAATKGLVTGIGSANAALLKDPTAEEKCPFNYPTGTTHTATAPTGQVISNDTLSCYFLNGTVTVGDVSSQTYSGGVVLDQSIYKSARFVNVPVLGEMPVEGSSSKYQIIDFRPGFITDQPSTDTRGASPSTANGLTWANNSLSAVNIIFLNVKALPNPPLDGNGTYIPYTGTGFKEALLVD